MKKISETERQNRNNLFRLMQEYPDLPVIPFVNAEIVAGDDFGYWMGSFGSACIDEYLLPVRRRDPFGGCEPVIFKSDDDIFDTLERMLSKEEFDALPETEKECKQIYDALPWKKAIVVYIETQEGTK